MQLLENGIRPLRERRRSEESARQRLSRGWRRVWDGLAPRGAPV